MSSYGTITVTTAATLIIDDNTSRKEIDIVNTDNSTTVFIGQDTSVTTLNGFPVYPNQNRSKVKVLTDYMGPIYGIVASGTSNVRFWESTQS